MIRSNVSLLRLPWLRVLAVVLVGVVAVCCAIGTRAGAPDGDPGERKERPDSERAVALRQLEIMKVALPALREADRKDAVELLERAIRAHEVMLEGRRDEEAAAIRQRAPRREQLAEVLAAAARLWGEFGNREKAAAVGQLARTFAARRDRPREEGRPDRERERPERERERPDRERVRREGDERAVALRQLEIMKLAAPALREGERAEALELLERAVRAREIALERRTDREANVIRQRAPNRRQLAEILAEASRLFRKFKHEEKATALAQLARQLAAPRDADRPGDRPRRETDRPERPDRPVRRDVPIDRIERLERRVAELARAVEALRAELREMKSKRD